MITVKFRRPLKGQQIAQLIGYAGERQNCKVDIQTHFYNVITPGSDAQEKATGYRIALFVPLKTGRLFKRQARITLWVDADTFYEQVKFDVYLENEWNSTNGVICGILFLCGIVPGMCWVFGIEEKIRDDKKALLGSKSPVMKELEVPLRAFFEDAEKELKGISQEIPALGPSTTEETDSSSIQ